MVVRAFVITVRSFPERGNDEHGDYGCELGEGNRIPDTQPLPCPHPHPPPGPFSPYEKAEGRGRNRRPFRVLVREGSWKVIKHFNNARSCGFGSGLWRL